MATYKELNLNTNEHTDLGISWTEFLLYKTEYTLTELYNATQASSSWVTCACGSEDVGIPRNYIGAPLDQSLNLWGMEFTLAIGRMYDHFRTPNFDIARKEAIDILDRIQKRSFWILNNIDAQITEWDETT